MSHSLMPKAPLVEGDQAGGAGVLVPEVEELKEQLEEELDARCSKIIGEMTSMFHYIYPRDTELSSAFVDYAMDEYKHLVFDDHSFNEVNVQSIRRVIDACNTNVKVTDFAPYVREVTRDLVKSKNKKIAELAGKIEEMTLGEFLRTWRKVFDTLKKYDYKDEARLISDYMDVTGRLMKVLEEEIVNIAMTKYGKSREEAERIADCVAMC